MLNHAPRTSLRWPARLLIWPVLGRYLLFFVAVVLAHATLLHLPYFWDEGGYYVPAALDFFHHWTLIPAFTNAHPPLPNVLLAAAWHLFGFHILVTRLTACAFAAAGLLATYELTRRLLNLPAAWVVTALTAVYPIWFAQSSLVHADIIAAAFTLAGLAVYLAAPGTSASAKIPPSPVRESYRLSAAASFCCLAVLAKETALLQPLVLAALELWDAYRSNTIADRREHLRWFAVLCTPVAVLAIWFGYHRWMTGFTFGNPTFLRYNATANFTAAHIGSAFWYRFLHLFWQRNIWVPVTLALACLLLPRRTERQQSALSAATLRTVAALLLGNWIAFSVLGGALLTRYLLPVYPLEMLVCVWVWQSRTVHWPWLAAVTGVAFVSAWWMNPPTYFAPEDNLTYRDMIVVHQEAIAYLQQHDPDATVLTAWPAAAELTRPELGYTARPFKIFSVDGFTAEQIAEAARKPGEYDAALIFSTHYIAPALQQYLSRRPNSRRGRKYKALRDLSPLEVAAALGGRVVWEDNHGGEWAAVLHFNRRYDADLIPPAEVLRSRSWSPSLPGIGPSGRR